MTAVSLDTGVIVEYLNVTGPLHKEAAAIFNNILIGRISAVIAHPILAETFYVAARVYETLGFSRPQQRAEKVVEWLYKTPHISPAEPSLELAVLAGKIKRDFALALTDAYVLATAKLYKGKALFRAREREIQERLDEMSREYEIVFLEG